MVIFIYSYYKTLYIKIVAAGNRMKLVIKNNDKVTEKKLMTLRRKMSNVAGHIKKYTSGKIAIINPFMAKRADADKVIKPSNITKKSIDNTRTETTTNPLLKATNKELSTPKTKQDTALDMKNATEPVIKISNATEPKKPESVTDTVKRPETTDKFPENLEGVTVLKKNIGGSNGASIIQDKNGNKFVIKTANAMNPQKKGQMKEEALADSIYQLMGIDVPKSKVYNNANGSVSKVSEYIEGVDLSRVSDKTLEKYPQITSNLQKGFAVDALLANWDSVGLVRDNIKVAKGGRTYRIDNGGSMRYRAMGADKGNAFTNDAGELWSLRKYDNLQGLDGGAALNSQDFFNGMSYGEVMGQVGDVLKQRQNIIKHLINKGADADLISKLNTRMEAFKSYYDKYTADKASGKSDKQIDEETEESVINARPKNEYTAKPQQNNQSYKSFVKQHANTWRF